jgi:hypothetical protein
MVGMKFLGLCKEAAFGAFLYTMALKFLDKKFKNY